jgi:hypothetical protein
VKVHGCSTVFDSWWKGIARHRTWVALMRWRHAHSPPDGDRRKPSQDRDRTSRAGTAIGGAILWGLPTCVLGGPLPQAVFAA